MSDLEVETRTATRLCFEHQELLLLRILGLGEAELRQPSALSGWSRAHVVAHLARNADAHARRVHGALRGIDESKYPGGEGQRAKEIEVSVRQSRTDLLADAERSFAVLATAFREAEANGWPNGQYMGGGSYPVTACPAHRLREILMHGVDLDIGLTPVSWPREYVDWEMGMVARTLPERISDTEQRAEVLAWLTGRAESTAGWRIEPWG